MAKPRKPLSKIVDKPEARTPDLKALDQITQAVHGTPKTDPTVVLRERLSVDIDAELKRNITIYCASARPKKIKMRDFVEAALREKMERE